MNAAGWTVSLIAIVIAIALVLYDAPIFRRNR